MIFSEQIMKKIMIFLLCLVLCFVAAGVGSLVTVPSVAGWYLTLNKPSFSPPNWIFGPVWTLLYFLMAISLYLVLISKSAKKEKSAGLKYFFSQLVFNTLWSIVFFGWHAPFFAFLDIILLWTLIFLTIKNFVKINKTAGWLLIPYLLWVSFASILNFAIVLLNH